MTQSFRRKDSIRETAQHAATDVTRRLACGAGAGMIAKTVTNPLERIKILSQTGESSSTSSSSSSSTSKQPQKYSVVRLYRDIIKHEGVLGLWAGNGANLVRVIPSKAIVFSTNDLYRNLLLSTFGGGSSNQDLQHHHKNSSLLAFVSGGMSGFTASAATYPLDLARGRMSGKLAGIDGHKHYSGILQTMRVTVADEGVYALWRGVTPTMLGAVPYEGIKFGTVGILENLLPKEESSLSGPTRKMLFGGLGGVVAGTVMYPNDTVRRLLQVQGSRGTTSEYTGYWQCLKHVYQTQGLRRLYRGMAINLIRMAPNTAIQFGSYELLKDLTAGWG
ncbi:hypothetical protein MPSEU_000445300 [Mayamaea pseudoterrestris]|nr:hypothetical protein MPSEU_000445300 [Mayamaea pseudoterrestris]